MDATEIRQGLLELAITKAHRLVEMIDEHDFGFASVDEEIEIDDVTWKVQVAYSRIHGVVAILANPMRPPNSLAEMLGWESPNDGYNYSVPVAWLPAKPQ